MFSIGRFAKICNVTIKALRYYEKVGLLAPVTVDKNNGYRYYTDEQKDLVKKISRLKELGIPIKSMKGILNSEFDQEEIMLLLMEHRKSLISQLELCNKRLAKMARWRNALVTGDNGMCDYNIYIEDVPSTVVRSKRAHLKYEKIMPFIMSSYHEITTMGELNSGPGIMLIHNNDFNSDLIDVEVACPVPLNSPVANKTLPAICAAKYIHVGPYDVLQTVYELVSKSLNQKGKRSTLPLRGIFHTDPLITPPQQMVIEINLPLDNKN